MSEKWGSFGYNLWVIGMLSCELHAGNRQWSLLMTPTELDIFTCHLIYIVIKSKIFTKCNALIY